MTGRWARAVTLIIGVATIASACSGSDGSEPSAPLESAEPITAPPPTDSAVATTTSDVEQPPTTVATTTTTSTTTTTTTEPVPSATTLDDLRAEIEADLNEGEQALLSGGGNPADPASIERLSNFFAGPALATVAGIYERLVSEGLFARPNPEIHSSYRVTAVLEAADNSATVLTCRVDAGMTVRVDDSGAEVVENDTVVVYTSRNVVTRDSGPWMLTDGETLTRIENETMC